MLLVEEDEEHATRVCDPFARMPVSVEVDCERSFEVGARPDELEPYDALLVVGGSVTGAASISFAPFARPRAMLR